MPGMNYLQAAVTALELIQNEVNLQTQKFGVSHDQDINAHGELMLAAMAQIRAVSANNLPSREQAFKNAEDEFYPKTWSGFRDYGSDIANLAVAAALLENEIKRRLMNGERFERSARSAP